MPPNQAIILRPASSIHTMFMRFALDIIYLDREDRVVKLVPNLVPFRLSAASGARTVIEMVGGATAQLGLEPGDRFILSPGDPA